MISLKRLAQILKEQFDDCRAGLPDGFLRVEYVPGKGKDKRGESLRVWLGRRDIEINRRGSVVNSGTAMFGKFKVVKVRA